jgi:hypothetical protein
MVSALFFLSPLLAFAVGAKLPPASRAISQSFGARRETVTAPGDSPSTIGENVTIDILPYGEK